MDMRELKALELAARAKITFNGTIWIVPSQSANGVYKVTIGADPTCECDDFQLRKAPCKHIIAARLVQARDGGGKAPEIVVDEVPKKKTYKQNWPLYDQAQQTENVQFQELLADLCRGIVEPPKKYFGRPATKLADQVFASAFKIFSSMSMRRFNCDLEEAHEKGYISKPLNPRSISAYLEEEEMSKVLENLIIQSSLPLRAIETVVEADRAGHCLSS